MPRKAPARRSAAAETGTKTAAETGTKTRGRRGTATESENKTTVAETVNKTPARKSAVVESGDDTPVRRSGRQRKPNTRFAEDEKEETVPGTEVSTPPKGKESKTPKKKKKSSDSKSDVDVEPQTSLSMDKQNKEKESTTPKKKKKSLDSKSDVDIESQTSPLLDEKDIGKETETPKENEIPSVSRSEVDNSKSQTDMLLEMESEEQSVITREKKISLVSGLEVDISKSQTEMDVENKGEETTIPIEEEMSSVPVLKLDNKKSQKDMEITEQSVITQEKKISLVLARLEVDNSKSQTEMDVENKGEETTIPIEEEMSSVPVLKLDNKKSQKDMEITGEETTIPIEEEMSSVPVLKLDNKKSQKDMEITAFAIAMLSNDIPVEKAPISKLKERLSDLGLDGDNSKSQTDVPIDKENTGEGSAFVTEGVMFSGSESESEGDNGKSQRDMAIDMEIIGALTTLPEYPVPVEQTVFPTENEMSTSSGSKVEYRKFEMEMPIDKEKTDENVVSTKNEISSTSRSEMENNKSQTDVSTEQKTTDNHDYEEDEENEVNVDFCHFYNRGINGCNTNAEECNWLHLCATCCEEHPVKTCKMQKEKENLKKKLFRRGRRGGRNSCEKRDIDICYYYNRNLNGCKVENCKLSHECFCCGEAHPIIACEHIELKNAYKSKCYNFNRGMLGCKEKNCEKLHCCFVCSKGHSIISCDQKENIGSIPAINEKSDTKKTAAIAFGIPFNLLDTDESHKNDGPLCYAFNEGPNGCSEPEGTCKAVHACYTCGENHPVKSCKQSPIKSTTKITKRKAKTNPKQNLEKLAKAIEEKKKMAKQKEEIRVLEEKKEMDEMKELCVLRLEEKIKLTKSNTAHTRTNSSNITHQKTSSLNTTNTKTNSLNAIDTKSNSSNKKASTQANINSSSTKTTLVDKKTITTKKCSLSVLDIESTKSGSKHKPISPPRPSKDIRISRKSCSFFNNGGCRNSKNCPFFHGCSYCNGNHPAGTCRKPRNVKVDFCSYFNRGPNGCRNIDRCPFIHTCYLCGGEHSGAQCPDKTSVSAVAKASLAPEQRERVKSQKITNVKRVSTSSNPEQYRSRYPSGEHRDSLKEHSEFTLSRLMDVNMSDQYGANAEYQDYVKYRSSRSERYDESSKFQDFQREDVLRSAYRSRSRERESSIECIDQYRSRSKERNISLERDHLKQHRSNSRERQLSLERDRSRHHRSRSRERVQRQIRMLAREQRSRSRERYRSGSQERIMASAEQMMEYQARRSKTGRAAVSPIRERRSRSRERNSRGSSTSDFDYLLRLQKESSRRKSIENHIKRELGQPSHPSSNKTSSRGVTSSKSGSSSSSFDAVEACIILSNFCSDLGLLGPTLEEICKRALADKNNILAFFRDSEVIETMEFVSHKLSKLKTNSSNELHKEKYGMGLSKIRQLMKESTNKHI